MLTDVEYDGKIFIDYQNRDVRVSGTTIIIGNLDNSRVAEKFLFTAELNPTQLAALKNAYTRVLANTRQ